MAESKSNASGKHWLLFGISLAVTIFMIFFVNEWFWVGLPFVLTYFVQAIDHM